MAGDHHVTPGRGDGDSLSRNGPTARKLSMRTIDDSGGMRDQTMTTAKMQQQWWMSPEQECRFCVSDFAVLAEIFCADCDRPVCPMCIVAVPEAAVRYICPDCREELERGG